MKLKEVETPRYLLCDVDIKNGKSMEKYKKRINFSTLQNRFPEYEVLKIEEIAPSRYTYILLMNKYQKALDWLKHYEFNAGGYYEELQVNCDFDNKFKILQELIDNYVKQEERIKELECICDKNNKTLDKYSERNAKLKKELIEWKDLARVNQYSSHCAFPMDKEKAKIPQLEGDGYADGQLVYDTWICPNCGQEYEVDCERYDYCPKCGQHIEWEWE